MKIILASASPRRRQMLKEAGFEFDILKIDVNESYPDDIPVEKVPLFVAQKKMDEAKKHVNEDATLITADTIVILDNEIIGKPADQDDAMQILKKLSGRMHVVISAVCILAGERSYSLEAETKVYFEQLIEEEITFYLNKYRPFDKAGAYAIQEWIGLNKISKIEGDYYNVVGFPMSKIYPILKAMMNLNHVSKSG